ncbi:hypothetical protein C8Q74DRAFT_1223959 [Fomes fomentarius]|nr:hypothetical protein C8Q74DRAFT_1223959 [Fomes fomentarius]
MLSEGPSEPQMFGTEQKTTFTDPADIKALPSQAPIMQGKIETVKIREQRTC